MYQTEARPTNLVEIMRQEPTHLSIYDSYDLGMGGIYINLADTRTSTAWCHPWTYNITSALVLETILRGNLTN